MPEGFQHWDDSFSVDEIDCIRTDLTDELPEAEKFVNFYGELVDHYRGNGQFIPENELIGIAAQNIRAVELSEYLDKRKRQLEHIRYQFSENGIYTNGGMPEHSISDLDSRVEEALYSLEESIGLAESELDPGLYTVRNELRRTRPSDPEDEFLDIDHPRAYWPL